MSGSTEATAQGSASPQAAGLFVYAVIPAADAGAWPGAPGLGAPSAKVRALEAGDLAALVSGLPPGRTPGRREDLEAYRRVLSIAMEHGTTIPIRFGMVIDGDDVVREELLVRHAPELTELMRTLDGKVQMSVRAFYAEDALLRGAMETDAEIARRSAAIRGRSEIESRPARIALGERVAAAVEARRAQDAQLLLDRLRPHATDLRVDPPGSERVALNAQLLVPRERRAELDEAVRELRSGLEGYLALRYVGPLPPYSFSELSLETGDG